MIEQEQRRKSGDEVIGRRSRWELTKTLYINREDCSLFPICNWQHFFFKPSLLPFYYIKCMLIIVTVSTNNRIVPVVVAI